MCKPLYPFVLLLLCLPFLGRTQFSVAPQLPPTGIITKDGLWNVMVVNNGNTSENVVVLVSVKEAASGQVLLSGGGRSVVVPKGAKMLSVQNVQPVQYTYSGPPVSGSYLSAGNYTICYTVNYATEPDRVLATECASVTVTPLSPVLLSLPVDKDTLKTQPQQFSWIPPAPLDMFSGLSYDLSVAEVLEGQTPAQALLYNVPVFIKGNVHSTYENYPSSYSGLKGGKTYAWQVVARSGMSYAQPTEVWTFSINGDSTTVAIESKSYLQLKSSSEETGVSYITGRSLNLKYYSFDKESLTAIKILTASGETKKEFKQKLAYGDNYFTLPLNGNFDRETLYRVELRDSQNRIYTAFFSLR